MINETNGKIIIQTQEDKRLDVAIELAKTINNLSEMLKNMETSISNIHIDGCNIETAQGETALYMGNGVKNSMVSNSIFRTDYTPPTRAEIFNEISDEEDEEPYDEAYEEGIRTFEENEGIKEVKRPAEVGEKIKVIYEVDGGWSGVNYPLNSIWTVIKKYPTDSTKPNDFSKGLVACDGNNFLIPAEFYVVLKDY